MEVSVGYDPSNPFQNQAAFKAVPLSKTVDLPLFIQVSIVFTILTYGII